MASAPASPPLAPVRSDGGTSSSSSSNNNNKLFVFGLGFSAIRAARAFLRLGFHVSGTVRSRESAAQLAASDPALFCFHATDERPQNVFVFDGERWDAEANGLSVEAALEGMTHLLVSVPTGRSEASPDPVLAVLGAQILALQFTLRWVAYLSTIGVYGETHGQVVDESAPVGSTVRRSQLRIRAERLWLDLPGLPVHVFRIAGIYGPGRGTITKVRSGSATRIHLPGRMFNRIHVDDIVEILLASAAKPNAGSIYNVCDDEPAPAEDVTAYACELLGVPVPPSRSWEEAEASMSAMAKSFYAESKVCSNMRVKNELGVKLRYPTYREGLLAQVLEEEAGADLDASTREEHLVVLANIGSLRAEPFLDLRQISFRLSRALQRPVAPCSFRFSHRVDASELNGLPAKTFEMVLTEYLKQKTSSSADVVVLPLFFGKSATLTEFLPQVVDKCWKQHPHEVGATLTLRVGRCVIDKEIPENDRVAQILRDRIQEQLTDVPSDEEVTVIVLDHGTPSFEVHEAREVVADQLRAILKDNKKVLRVLTACMERREGPEYDFNDPLLEHALDHYDISSGVVVVAKMFFSGGRHAGENGDIEEISNAVKLRHPGVQVRVTEPLGSHMLLTDILKDRFLRVAGEASPDLTLE